MTRIRLEDARSPRVGPSRKALLLDARIQTAADITWNKLEAIAGFGPTLTQAVLSWQQTALKGYRYDPHFKGVLEEIARLDSDFRKRSQPLITRIRGANTEIQRLRANSHIKRAAMVQALDVIDEQIADIDRKLA